MPFLHDSSGGTTTDASTLLGAPTPVADTKSAPPTLSTSAPTVATTPQPGQGVALDVTGRLNPTVVSQSIPVLTADPGNRRVGQIWYRSDTSQLSIQHDANTIKRVTFA